MLRLLECSTCRAQRTLPERFHLPFAFEHLEATPSTLLAATGGRQPGQELDIQEASGSTSTSALRHETPS